MLKTLLKKSILSSKEGEKGKWQFIISIRCVAAGGRRGGKSCHLHFLWRIDQATKGGGVRIANNHFGPAPVGSAIYSIITKEAEAQIVLENNTYESDENYLTKGVFTYELQ